MEIRFVSSLTIDDENRLAPALLQALAALLRTSPLAYTIRIETAGGEVFEHQQAPTLQTVGGPLHERQDVEPTPARHGTVMPFRN